MFIYLITFLLFICFSFLEVRTDISERTKKYLYTFLFFFLVFQVGFRWQTGTDWFDYLRHFAQSTSYEAVLINVLLGYEIGYGSFVFLVRSFTDNYTVFLVLHAVLYYFLVFKANKILSPFPFLSLLVFYASTMGILGSNKQLIALAICFYSLKYLLDGKSFKFFLLVFIAFLFHTSALLFLIYYFLNRDIKKKYILLSLVLAIVIGKSSLPNLLFSNFANFLGGALADKAEKYGDNNLSATSLSLIGLIRRLLFFSLFFINYDKITSKFPTYKLLFNGFFVGLLIYFLFSGSLIVLAGRGSFYFNIMECFLMSSQLLLFKSKKDRAYLLLVFFIYSYFIFFQSIAEYPELFIPYNGVLDSRFPVSSEI
ncbi:EpsG family protein [Flavobacterium sp.]|uniref:EpsG family protein n=1 Tax=Flavobacterium sp. TaxID=239 RepID=UPI0031CEBB03